MSCARYQGLNKIYQLGNWTFQDTNVKIGALGISGLKHFVGAHQQVWQKEDIVGQGRLSTELDPGMSLLHPDIRSIGLDGGVGLYRIRQNILLDRDFGSFPANGVALLTRRDGAVTWMKLNLYRQFTLDPNVNGVDVKPTNPNEWQLFSFSPGGSYSPGDEIMFELEYKASAVDVSAMAGDVQIVYVTAQGNV